MSAANFRLKIIDLNTGKESYKDSENVELLLKALGIEDIAFSKFAAGVLEISAKLKVTDGDDATHVATKGQLDTAIAGVEGQLGTNTTNLQNQIDTLSGRADALETHDGVLDGQIVALQAKDTSLDGDIAALQAADTALDGRVDALETHDGVLDGQVAALQAADTVHDGQISDLQAADVAIDARVDSLETRADATDDSINNLQVVDTGHDADIANLQSNLAAILANNPEEETFTVGVGGQSVFNLTAFAVDADNTKRDVEAYVDGRRILLDTTGGLTKGFRKNSTTQVETAETIPEGKEVTFYKQGTSATGVDSDLTAITVSPRPSVDAALPLGTQANTWSGVYLKDTVTAQKYRLEIVSGGLQITEVP